jgi:hypothetical protein
MTVATEVKELAKQTADNEISDSSLRVKKSATDLSDLAEKINGMIGGFKL